MLVDLRNLVHLVIAAVVDNYDASQLPGVKSDGVSCDFYASLNSVRLSVCASFCHFESRKEKAPVLRKFLRSSIVVNSSVSSSIFLKFK